MGGVRNGPVDENDVDGVWVDAGHARRYGHQVVNVGQREVVVGWTVGVEGVLDDLHKEDDDLDEDQDERHSRHDPQVSVHWGEKIAIRRFLYTEKKSRSAGVCTMKKVTIRRLKFIAVHYDS